MNYQPIDTINLQQAKALYQAVGWQSYLHDDCKLKTSFDHTFYTYAAFDQEQMVGMIRCFGDGVHLLYIQDLIVAPSYQQQGIGSCLFEHVQEKFRDVRHFFLVTDLMDEVDNKFYQAKGGKTIHTVNMVGYVF